MRFTVWQHVRERGVGVRLLTACMAVSLAIAVAWPGTLVYASDGDAAVESTATVSVVEPAAEEVVDVSAVPDLVAEEEPSVLPQEVPVGDAASEAAIQEAEAVSLAPLQQPVAPAALSAELACSTPVCMGGVKLDESPRDGVYVWNTPHTVETPTTPGDYRIVLDTYSTADGMKFDFTSNYPVELVIVKGGSSEKTYSYDPAVYSGTGLHAPRNASGRYADVSHIIFCFGEAPDPELGDLTVYKYLDDNENGSYDQGEEMLSGWEFEVRDASDAVVGSGMTDTNGEFSLTDLEPGVYDVTETLQTGWDNTTPLTQQVTVVDDETATLWFGNVPDRGDVIVYKFLDENENGEYDEGEEMLSGWEFSLSAAAPVPVTAAPAEVIASGATDDNGELSFTLLPTGEYTVTETLQDGWDNTTPLTQQVTVVDDETATLWFGNVPDRGDVTVYKYQDDNMNAQYDEGEEMLSGWAFEIYDATDALVGSGVTDANGQLSFEGLQPGLYTAVETLQSGWANTTPLEQAFEVIDDEGASVWFGNVELGGILVHKFLDENENGAYDEGEELLADWEFTVTQESMPIEYRQTAAVALVGQGMTDANGEFGVDDLFPGEYIVRETMQDGWFSTTGTEETVQVLAGQLAEVWVGNAPVHGDLVVYKFLDENENGLYDEGEEMLPDWAFTLYDGDGVEIDSGVTDENGEIVFDDLKPGDYSAAETLQEGWVNTTDLEQDVTVVSGEVSELWFGNIDEALPFTEIDLVITKKADVETAEEGDIVTYTITWWNDGATPAEDYTIVDDFDERYVTVIDAAGGTVAGGKITWTFAGPLAKEDGKQTATYKVRINAEMPDGTTNVDNVVVIAHPDDIDLTNNTDDDRVVVRTEFLPFTGGEYLLLFGLALLALIAGGALRARAARAA